MRSRVLRITLAATLLVAAAAAAAFLVYSERNLSTARAGLREFDRRARETVDVLSDARAALQAYVAAGQGLDYWIPRAAELVATARRNADELQPQARSEDGRAALQTATAAIDDLAEVDARARGYLHSHQILMAGDVIYTEGESTAAAAGHQIEAARLAEHAAFAARETIDRRLEAGVLAGAGVLAVMVALLLAPSGHAEPEISVVESLESSSELPLHAMAPEPQTDEGLASLKTAAELCSAFSQVTELEGVKSLLGGVAGSLGATGLIVWVGGEDGADLHPALAHGYPPPVLARMTAIQRTADNAAAAAYRTGRFQIVRAAQNAPGALVAPLLAPGGCIGALTAEVRGGRETSESVRALATLYAAQLAGLLSTPPAAEPVVPKTAAG